MATLKKSGEIRIKDYQSDQFCKPLLPLVTRLNQEIPDAKLDPKGLGLTVGQILQFQDDALGINSLKPRPFPKLPIQLLEDVRPGGALALVAARLAAIKRATPQLKAFEWNNPGSRRFNLESLQIVRADLIRGNLLKVPVVAAHPSCGADGDKALEAARNLQATVVDDPADPSVTHVLYPNGALTAAEDDEAAQMRTLQTSGQRARVHWRFLPDSYAEWVPLRSAPTAISERTEPPGGKGPWRVALRWALDSEKFNEWMNPQDYEADERKAKSVAAAEAAAALGVTGAAGAAEAAAKRGAAAQLAAAQAAALAGVKRSRGDAEIDTAEPNVEVAPGAFKRRVLNPHGPAVDGSAAAENISQGQLDPTAPLPAVEPPPQQSSEQQQQQKQQQQPAAERSGAASGGHTVRSFRYLMPMHAAWFSHTAIHNHERRALQDTTNGSIPGFNLSMYAHLRNTLVALYRREPQRRLTFQDACSAAKQYPPEAMRRVHAFLDSWGIINWLAPRCPVPAAAALPAGTQLAAHSAVAERPQLPPGHALAGSARLRERALRAATSSGPGLLLLATPTTADAIAAAGAGGTLPFSSREARGSRLESMTTLAAGRRRFFCSAMPYVECTQLRYHCTKVPGVDLCPQAYAEGRFPPGCSAADFVRLEGGADAGAPGSRGGASGSSAAGTANNGWTPQETLLLLEGMQMHGDNWPHVAEHVGTHNVLDCITHFLQLPIEDDFLDELEHRAASPSGSASIRRQQQREQGGPSGAEEEDGAIGRVPFDGGDAAPGNPVMSLLPLLSVVLAPRIASEAAQAALEALASDDPIVHARRIEAARCGTNWDGGEAAVDVDDVTGSASGAAVDDGQPPDPTRPVTAEQARAAADVALAAAAARAKLMADEQGVEMERLTLQLLKAQLKRVNIKLKYLQQLDQVIDSEQAKHAEVLRGEADKSGDARRKK